MELMILNVYVNIHTSSMILLKEVVKNKFVNAILLKVLGVVVVDLNLEII
jgi:hypothetical protein